MPETSSTWRTRTALTGVLVLIALIAAACGGGGTAADKPAARGSATAVRVDTFMFSPKVLPVHAGDKVTWTNKDNILHTVTSGTREYEPGNGGQVTATHTDGMFDMQLDGRGATAAFTFTKAGTYHYFCNRHPGMEADVDVS